MAFQGARSCRTSWFGTQNIELTRADDGNKEKECCIHNLSCGGHDDDDTGATVVDVPIDACFKTHFTQNSSSITDSGQANEVVEPCKIYFVLDCYGIWKQFGNSRRTMMVMCMALVDEDGNVKEILQMNLIQLLMTKNDSNHRFSQNETQNHSKGNVVGHETDFTTS